MGDLGRGIATFNSCNKAGSIPFFTSHLDSHPDNYQALMWRARAREIIGDNANCIADLRRAKEVSSGIQQMAAEAELAKLNGNIPQYVFLLKTITQLYPQHAFGWSNYASLFFSTEHEEEALKLLHKAIETADKYQQTDSLDTYCWDNYYLGSIYFRNEDLDRAEKYFKAAIRSSSSLTVAHVGLGQVYLKKENVKEAKDCYDTARQLNPKLAHWESFDAFRHETETMAPPVTESKGQKTGQSQNNKSPKAGKGKRNKDQSAHDKSSPVEKRKGNKYTGTGGNMSGGNSSSSDDDDDDPNTDNDEESTWDKLVSETSWKARIGSRMYVLSKCGKFWYSKDTAHHGGHRSASGGAYVKVYQNKSNTLKFLYAADKNLKPILQKHESREGTEIKKSDLSTVFRK